nr:MAG TPA: Protein RecA, 1st part, 2nd RECOMBINATION, DNA REPAIR, ATPASE.6A [Caudoviricetes sp.]
MKSPQFLAHVLLKFVAVGSEKYTLEDNGFDGFGVRAEIIKSRTNQAGQMVPLVYDKIRGVDSLRSTLNYAKEAGLLGGNKNGAYFLADKTRKFPLTTVHEAFREDPTLFKWMYDNVIPVLKQRLSAITEDEKEVLEEEFDY